MPKKIMFKNTKRSGALIPGTLDMLILKALSGGKAHGYAIAEWIHSVSQETLQVEEGALYPALHRLELGGMLDSDWGVSDTNRRVKFYRLTRAGRRQLAAEHKQWQRLTAAMMLVLEST